MINAGSFDDKVRLKEFGTISPYYSSKTLLQYFENTIEKKYHLKGDEIGIYIQMRKSDEGKIPLKGRIEVIINGNKKEFRFDFSDEIGLSDQLLSLKGKVETFVSENKVPGMIYKNLNTRNNTLVKRGNIIYFPDGFTVDTSNIKLEDVKRHKECGFIYGSNLAGILGGGQAIYGGENNTFGIPTRPNLNSYFSDQDYNKIVPEIDKAFEILFNFMKNKKPVIIPTNGVGTGFAKLQVYAPKILNHINQKLNNIKEINLSNGLIK